MSYVGIYGAGLVEIESNQLKRTQISADSVFNFVKCNHKYAHKYAHNAFYLRIFILPD